MTEPVVSDELTQGVRDAQAKFDQGMGAAGDASPYPMLAELRHRAAVHRGWPEMGVPAPPAGEKQIFSVYSFDAVKEVFTDNTTFSTRCYEDIVRPLQGPTILEMQEPEHAVYRRLHELPSPVRQCGGGRPSWCDRWWSAPSRGSARRNVPTSSKKSSCRSRCGSSRR